MRGGILRAFLRIGRLSSAAHKTQTFSSPASRLIGRVPTQCSGQVWSLIKLIIFHHRRAYQTQTKVSGRHNLKLWRTSNTASGSSGSQSRVESEITRWPHHWEKRLRGSDWSPSWFNCTAMGCSSCTISPTAPPSSPDPPSPNETNL